MSQAKEADDFGEGFILPPLIVQLRKILDQYADDCQILKELIQNAEDAGAKEIKFLYDRHSYGTDPRQLHKPSLAKFQGPALYAFNDGLFDDEDWKGIRMLSQSVKQEDPFKVGYFGMGFKSVFHLTDLPFILSGERVGVIDPHQKHFDGTTYGWSMAKKKDLLDKLRHQFEPFLGHFGCTEETFKQGFYNGTIFRFPLRNTASPLSDVVYTNERAELLFESFRDGAHEIPLFLKHLEKIQLWERDKYTIEPKLVFEIRLGKECIREVRQNRSDFLNQTRPVGGGVGSIRQWLDAPVVSTCTVNVETVTYERGEEIAEGHRFLVTNYYSGGSVSAIFRKLNRDTDLNYPPWVGLAMPLDVPNESTFQLDDSDGHVFCFLPLSLEQKTPTGLPVHVNGFFALEQNRKYLKWASSYRTREDLMDKRLLWNQCLLREAIPRAYVHLLLSAIRKNREVNKADALESVSPEIIYRAFPSFHSIDRKWEVIMMPLYTELFKHEVIFTTGAAKWVHAKDAIFNTLDNSHGSQDIILEALTKSEVAIASAPPHVLDAIKRTCHISMGKITASIVSTAFKAVQAEMSLPWEDKIEVLRFFLKQGKFDLLDGLELLPLSNGGFQMFYYNPRRADRAIYIASDKSPQSLLPGLEDDFLDEELDDDIKSMLRRASEKGYTQLKILTPELLVQLLQKCIPEEWRQGGTVTWNPAEFGHPPSDWLEKIWMYLLQNCTKDLTPVQDLPIIPLLIKGEVTTLVPLSSQNALICKELDGNELDECSQQVLTRLGVHVIEELPSYIKAHVHVQRRYVFSPTYMGVLKCLVKLTHTYGLEGVVAKIHALSSDEKRQLRRICAKISSYELKAEYKVFLQKLPMFEMRKTAAAAAAATKKKDDAENFVTFDECNIGAPNEILPIPVSRPLLDLGDVDSLNLGKLLGVQQLSVVQLLVQIVFKDIEEAFYEPDDVETVMLYVLRHYHYFLEIDSSLATTLKSLPFILRHNIFVMPNRFYDPDHELLQKLFYAEENFPTGAYADPAMTSILREFGLRGLADVEPEDILATAVQIQTMSEKGEGGGVGSRRATLKVLEKSDALLEYLQKYANQLNESERTELFESLKGIRWVRRMEQRPSFYPQSLDWFRSEHMFEKPCDATSKQYTNIAGSAMPIHAYDMDGEFAEAFGWSKPPCLERIVEHFKRVVKQYAGVEKAKFMDIASSVYQLFAQADDVESVLKELDAHEVTVWLWHGEGFCEPPQIIFNEPFMDLRPFVYPLPTEMATFTDFFAKCGVKQHCHLPGILTNIKTRYDAETDNKKSLSEIKRDLHICVSVLNELKGFAKQYRESGTDEDLEELTKMQEELVLPLHRENDFMLKMAALEECTFCDQEWLRQGHELGDWFDGEDNMQFVHPNVPTATSETLGVPTLMSRMLEVEELDFSFGQADSLTHRLNVLLQEYTDGFAVPKELVQNADDAGATEVRILYDERANADALTCLIDEGMRECQGPAIWAYNNAVFTDDDFENITKLSGATKETQTDKIGRFGLGFNAVYNLTDVPSFISRQNIVIFDPHTTHLGKSIKNKSKPGIKIDMKKHRKKLKRLGNQFKPYNEIFGCDLRPNATQDSYNGTLFRFPLRTKSQAIKSEICQRHYDENEVKSLLRMLVTGAESLLLFTQNVLKISVYHLPKHVRSPTGAVEIFSISKNSAKILRELAPLSKLPPAAEKLPASSKALIAQSSMLKEATEVMKQLRHGASQDQIAFPASSQIIHVDRITSIEGERLLSEGLKRERESRPWLVCSRMGSGESLRLAIQDDSLLATAGIALPLKKVREQYVPLPIMQHGGAPHGCLFTYLPLPIRSGLPVHVNAAFAVTSNRRYLCERNEDDKLDVRAIWNEALLADSVCGAYLQAMEDLTAVVPCDQVLYHLLWPHGSHIDSNVRPLLTAFYQSIVQGPAYSLPILSDQNQYVAMENAVYLNEELSNSTKIKSTLTSVLQTCLTSQSVVDMPVFVLQGCTAQDTEGVLQNKAYSTFRIFKEVLVPNITAVQPKERDTLILHILQSENSADVKELLAESPCIPVSPAGEEVKAPNQLVDPFSELAHLYTPADGRFPHGAYAHRDVLKCIGTLGMAQQEISWEELCERAEAISQPDAPNAAKRAKVLLAFMELKLESGEHSESELEEHKAKLMSLPLLPVARRPSFFPLAWSSDALSAGQLLPATEMYSQECKDLVCLVEPVLDESVLPRSSEHVQRFLGFQAKEPGLTSVLEQLEKLTETTAQKALGDRQVSNELQRMCFQVYSYLQTTCVDEGHREVICSSLEDKAFILCHNQYLRAAQMSFTFTHNCAPYIFSVTEMLKRNFTELLKVVGVKESFETHDYVAALQSMHREYGQQRLNKDTLKLALQLVSFLNDSMADRNQTLSEVVEQHGTIYIPDAQGILRTSSALCFNEPEVQWVPTQGFTNYSHPLIPFTISKQLGVNTKRQEVLKKHSRGIPFGQRERLTNRLKRILSSYPCDKEILKELLQNADDAGATEIHFVLDPRQHGTEKVFDESWKPLQGPALCVFNDTPFTEADLEGIKKLGEGSKGTDPNKTGQYGVGFNCVYHLTDAPSFLTMGPEIGETLCVFDPHAKFVPGATPEEPGRRYDDVTELRQIFTDVFPCYLEDKFPIRKGGTMFRFPLRTPAMASESELSETSIEVDMVETLLNKFKGEMLDCLLFVNHVKTISIHHIDRRTGRLSGTHSVSTQLSLKDEQARQTFSDNVAKVSRQIAAGELQIWDIPRSEVNYVLNLVDNKGYKEKWLVHQSIGLPEGQHIQPSVYDAFRRGELSLLPRGGATCLLSSSSPEHQRASRAFCFLPLPLRTGLPQNVNVNGHFALDTEARRHLWHDEELSAKTEWNFLLLRHVIAPSYVALLRHSQSHLSTKKEKTDLSLMEMAGEAVPSIIQYNELFPRIGSSDPYWKCLGEAVYRHIHESQEPVLPVVRPSSLMIDSSPVRHGHKEKAEVEWMTTTGVGLAKPYFDNLSDTLEEPDAMATSFSTRRRLASTPKKDTAQDVVRNALLTSGFKLLNLPLEIYEAFRNAGVEIVECVNPKAVMEFYRGYKLTGTCCTVRGLPSSIADTPFRGVEGIKQVLAFCARDDKSFTCSLDGLPLLLCEDEQLRQFDRKDKVYLSKYHSLLPDCDAIFVHDVLAQSVLSGADVDAPGSVFLRLDVSALAGMLPNSLPEVDMRSETTHVDWPALEKSTPNPRWIWMLWTFLGEEFDRILAKQTGPVDDEELAKLILRPLQDWAILPAHIHSNQPGGYYSNGGDTVEEIGQQYLVPIGLANTILDFSQTSIVNHAFRESLRKLGLPELSSSIMDSGPPGLSKAAKSVQGSANSSFARLLVASLESPRAILAALHYAIEFKGRASSLKVDECYLILKYFNDCAATWSEDAECTLMLRQLPMYLSAHGQLVRLGKNTAYVLPGDLPQNDMDVWEKQLSIVFLRRQPGLEQLHHAINCGALSATELYTKFIFRNFDYLREEGRKAHMEFIRDVKLPQLGGNFRKSFIESLHKLAWLPASGNQYMRACDFHDPYHPVFKVMLANYPGAFPPDPFDSFKWLEFLRLIGLQHTVSQERLIEFTEHVAVEGSQEPSEETFNKARTLVTHLFKRDNLTTEDSLLNKISDIPFIPAGKINAMMEKIFPSHSELEDQQTPYIKFCEGVPENHEVLSWSSTYILPDWANPYKLSESDVSFSYPPSENGQAEGESTTPMTFDKYIKDLASKLRVNEDPTAEQVVEHTRNVCSNIYTQLTDMDELKAFMKVDVMKKVYKFLQQKCMGSDVAKKALEDTCCIVIDLGYTFVKPGQVVVDLYEEDQIAPYLYKVPTELGEFKKLFVYLGATSNPTFDQYAMVLESIYHETKGEKLHPNELRAAFKAVFELFAILKRHPGGGGIRTRVLYLPSVTGRLFSSTELVFNNDPTYTDRIRFFDKPFLVELSECMMDRETNFEDLIRLLPERLQPSMLTDLVIEVLEERCLSTMDSFIVSDKLRHQLNSRAFCMGLQRIIKHEQRRSGQKVSEEQMDAIQYALKRIRVFGVRLLYTYLSYSSVKIPQSDSECECFHNKMFNSDENEDQWYIYIDNNLSLNDELLVSVAEVVNKIAGGLLRNSVHYLQPIISCAPHAISKVLDRLKVRPDHSVDAKQPTLPVPGSFIPLEDHHLLREDFELYEQGEYVGCELEDDDIGGPTFIYAIIEEKIADRGSTSGASSSKLSAKYRINVGGKSTIAMVTDLYRFHRVEGFVSRNTSIDPDSFSSSPRTPHAGHTSRIFRDNLHSEVFDAPPSPQTPKTPKPGSRFRRIPEEENVFSEPDGHPTWSQYNLNGHSSTPKDRRYFAQKYKAAMGSDDEDENEAKTFATDDTPSYRDQFFQTEEERERELLERERKILEKQEKERMEREKESSPETETEEGAAAGGEKPAKPKGGPVIPEMGEGDTIEDVLERVSDTLEEAWALSEKERKKIIKRLLLKWHPDKNIGNEQIATIVTQHIQGEIERLNEGRPRPGDFKDFVSQFNFDPRNPFSENKRFQETFYNAYQYFYDQVNQRAKAHKENRERYKEYFSKEYSSTNSQFNFDVPPSFSSSNPQPAQAKRFLRQAQEDLRATDNDYEAREPAYEWVCFKAHQAAEKALKAAQFSVDATTSFNHDLASIAATLEDLELRRLAMRLQKIIGNANKLYNPDPIEFVIIPHDEYNKEAACDAIMCAADILERVKEFVENKEM